MSIVLKNNLFFPPSKKKKPCTTSRAGSKCIRLIDSFEALHLGAAGAAVKLRSAFGELAPTHVPWPTGALLRAMHTHHLVIAIVCRASLLLRPRDSDFSKFCNFQPPGIGCSMSMRRRFRLSHVRGQGYIV